MCPSPLPKPESSATQTSLTQSMFSGVPYERNSIKWKEITNAVAFHVAKDMIPIYTVEKPSFKRLLQTLDPRYKMPSRKYFSEQVLPKMYSDVREKVTAKLNNVGRFSTSSDLWSIWTMEPYMSLTVHYIDDDWEVKSLCFQTSYEPDSNWMF